MTYLNDVHGIIIGGVQNYIRDECTYDENDNLIQILEPTQSRELGVGIMRAHGAHKVASFLRENGADVEVIDYAFTWTLEELKDLWKSRYYSKTFFLCISTTFRNSSLYLWQFVEWVRENYPHIHILGGTQSIDKIIPFKLDWYVFGYGEYAMLELIKSLKDQTTSKIKYSKVGSKKIINAQKHYKSFPKKQLSLSYEDRDFIQPWEVLPMELARGCIFQCAFCTYPILGVRDDHSRDEQDFYKELRENYDRWGTQNYVFSDETVNDYHSKLERYASVIKDLPFKPRFGGFARGDLIAGRKKSWDTYIELGFMSHFYGIESMYRPAARSVGKGMETGKLQDGLLEFREYAEKNHDFYTGYISLIAGLPNETFDTLEDTYSWVKKNWQDQFSFITALSIQAPIFTKKHSYIVEELGNYSLIEADPAKYGYEIIKDYEPGSQIEWKSNTGMTSKSATEWVKSKGIPLTHGSVPPWNVPEFMVDPSISYLDMMVKGPNKSKMKTILALDLQKTFLDVYNTDLDKLTMKATMNMLQINERSKVESLEIGTNWIESSKVDGVQFSSGGRHLMSVLEKHKIDRVRKYKKDKINA